MTPVNWERESGEKIEEFVSALILLDNPSGNRLTPSRGDRGVDVQVRRPDGKWEIYQIKKFTRPLNGSKKRQIEDSWRTFLTETLPAKQVHSWTLVMPCDPTPQSDDWFQNLTHNVEVEARWWGLSHLDGLAAERQNLVDYYFGDGGRQIRELISSLLSISGNGADNSTDPFAQLLERQQHLSDTLSRLDPFYRYVVDIRSGDASNIDPSLARRDNDGAALVQYLQLNEDQYAVTRVLPLSAESATLSPISANLSFHPDPGSKQHRALQEFLDYGTPFEQMPGELTSLSGPPGLLEDGKGVFSVTGTSNGVDLPPLELQLVRPSFGIVQRLPLHEPQVARGVRGGGVSVTSRDESGTLRVVVLLKEDDGRMELGMRVRTFSGAGAFPADLVDAVRFVSQWDGKNEIVLAIRNGRPLTPPLVPDERGLREQAKSYLLFLDDLQVIQRHTFQAVRVPDLSAITPDEYESIQTAARLLRGETVSGTWDSISIEAIDASDPLFSGEAKFRATVQERMYVLMGGNRIELSPWMEAEYSAAQLASGTMRELVPDSEGTVSIRMIDPPQDLNERTLTEQGLPQKN